MLTDKKKQQAEKLFKVLEEVLFTPKDLIRSKSRVQKAVTARMFFAFFARLKFDMSLGDIARLINKDHSSIVHLQKKIYLECSYNDTIYKQMLLIANKLINE